MAYNLTWLENSTDFVSMYTGINTNLNGIPSIMLLVTIFFATVFLARNSTSTEFGIGIASFVTLIFASLFWLMNFISWQIMLVPVFLLISSVVYIKFFN